MQLHTLPMHGYVPMVLINESSMFVILSVGGRKTSQDQVTVEASSSSHL